MVTYHAISVQLELADSAPHQYQHLAHTASLRVGTRWLLPRPSTAENNTGDQLLPQTAVGPGELLLCTEPGRGDTAQRAQTEHSPGASSSGWNTALLRFQTTHTWTVNKCSRGILVHSSRKMYKSVVAFSFSLQKNTLVASLCKYVKELPKRNRSARLLIGGRVGFVGGFYLPPYTVYTFASTFVYLEKVLIRFL